MTQLHEKTFEYLELTDDQAESVRACHEAVAQYARTLSEIVPDGADKTYALRKLRDVAMWVNVAITRNADGSPRADEGQTEPS